MITASLKLHRGRLERILRPKPQAQPIGQPRIRRTIRPLNRPYPMIQRVPTGKRRTRIILRAHKAHQLLLQSLRAVRRPRRRVRRRRRRRRLPRCVLHRRGRHDDDDDDTEEGRERRKSRFGRSDSGYVRGENSRRIRATGDPGLLVYDIRYSKPMIIEEARGGLTVTLNWVSGAEAVPACRRTSQRTLRYVLVVASRKGGRVLRLWVRVWVRFGQACGARLFEAVFTWASDSKDGFRERRRGRPAVYGYIELR